MTFTCICECGKKFFSQNKNSKTCYGCALESITAGSPPEEGDINTALIVSGEISDKDARHLQADLESIDYSDEEVRWRRMLEYYDDEDHRWDYLEQPDEDE